MKRIIAGAMLPILVGIGFGAGRIGNDAPVNRPRPVPHHEVDARIVDKAVRGASKCGGKVIIEWNRVQADWEILVIDCDQ